MERSKILSASYLDLLFDGRNKSYGSYDLRIHYHERLKKALAIPLLFLAFCCAYVLATDQKTVHFKTPHLAQKPISVSNLLIEVPQPIKKREGLPKPTAPAAKAKTFAATAPVIAKDPLQVKPQELPDKDAVAGVINNQEGVKEGAPTGVKGGSGSTESLQNGHSEGGKKGSVNIYKYTAEMPSFPGGADNLVKWLQDHLRYPSAAREANKEGTVYLSFVVNEDGSIAQIEIVRGFGYGSEEEALRVMKLMPKWTPGRQNNIPVKVLYNLPLTFRME